MRKILVNGVIGTVFLFLGCWIFFIFFYSRSMDPATLPDHDFLPEVEKMMAEKRFPEAEQLCCDMVGMDLPNAVAANQKLLEIRRARSSWGRSALDTARGFLTGEGENSAAIAGAILSDLWLYGDLRDLGIQAYNKIKGRPVDRVMVAIAGVGAFSELLGFAGSIPAMVKYFYRAGALSSGMVHRLQETFFRGASKGTITASDKKLLKDFTDLTKAHGLKRSGVILRSIKTPEELAAAVKLQKKAPEVPRLLAYGAPEDCGQLLVRYSEGPLRLVKTAVRKGAPGADLLRKIRIVKWSAKNILKGRFHDLMVFSAIENPSFARALPWCGGAFLLLSLFFYVRGAVSGGIVSRYWRKKHSKAEVGS